MDVCFGVIGAESGVDLAMNELRKRVTRGPSDSFQLNWATKTAAGTFYPDYGHAFPATRRRAYTLPTHLGEGNTAVQARGYVDERSLIRSGDVNAPPIIPGRDGWESQ